jgi:hypothetical protein
MVLPHSSNHVIYITLVTLINCCFFRISRSDKNNGKQLCVEHIIYVVGV